MTNIRFMTFTIQTATPKSTALLFQGILGADKGHASTLRREGADYVVESDGKTVRFTSR